MTPSGRVAAVIPARMASTRLPGKPLADIAGKPMIQWAWECASGARGVDDVVVATDSPRIVEAVERFGGRAMLTRADHASGTDRVAEVATRIDARIVINLQGDEPLLPMAALETLVSRFGEDRCPMGTMVTPLTDPAELANPARVKVVCRRDGRALYFSRLPIPCDRDGSGGYRYMKHLGVYIFRREFLLEFARIPPSPLEETERLEQLRALENGHEILVVPVEYDGQGVDTPDDLEAVRRLVDRRSGAGEPVRRRKERSRSHGHQQEG
ncbi:MAG: 3-deoxy-manno-octulosonate cytidylyltransferase [Candidatus Riflebacteria bacterium]|nr:3-deoxy-manno-octulosonate cytidylyltransferase [Candidatus Riflebacteria bacterium]